MPLIEQFEILRRETRRRLGAIATTVMLVSLLMLALGLLWTEKYKSSTTILIEDQNIIGPLLEGTTVPTDVRSQADIAKAVIYSRDVLQQVLEVGGWLEDNPTPLERELLMEELMEDVEVVNVGENLIRISYEDESPQRAFQVVMTLSSLFIDRSREAKHDESSEAYTFIAAEVDRYREKLRESEQRLRDFLAANGNVRPGTVNAVDSTVADLMRRIQTVMLDLEEARIRARSLAGQLSDESATMASITREEQIVSMIAGLQAELAELRLRYHDTYPDIVSTKYKIDMLRSQLEQAQLQREAGIAPAGGPIDGVGLNPLHQEIRAELSKARTQIAALETRLAQNREWLAAAQNRGEEVAEVEVRAAELTRDYEVNNEIFQDLLRRRESARIAMNMDEEGEGLSMSIQEPPTVPLYPAGIRFIHFALVGPLLGAIFAFAGVFARVRFDDRIRTGATISRELAIPVLANVPVLMDDAAKSRQRRVWTTVMTAALVVVACYAFVGVLRINDFL